MRMILSHARVGWLASVRIAEGITIFEQEVEKKTCRLQACNFIVKRKRESLLCKSVRQLRISVGRGREPWERSEAGGVNDNERHLRHSPVSSPTEELRKE